MVCLDEESTTPRCRIIDGLPYLRIHDIDNEPYDRSWSVELSVISASISHILEESLIDIREVEKVFLILEIQSIDNIDHFTDIISVLDFIRDKVKYLPDLVLDRMIVCITSLE